MVACGVRCVVLVCLVFAVAECNLLARRGGGHCRKVDGFKCVDRAPEKCGEHECTAPFTCQNTTKPCEGQGKQGCPDVCGEVGTPCGTGDLLCKFNEKCVDKNLCNPLGLDPNCNPSHACEPKDDWEIESKFMNPVCTAHHTITAEDTCGTLLAPWGAHSSRFFRFNQGFNCSSLVPGTPVCSAGRLEFKEIECGGEGLLCDIGFECIDNSSCEFLPDGEDAQVEECKEESHKVCGLPVDFKLESCGGATCKDGQVCEKVEELECDELNTIGAQEQPTEIHRFHTGHNDIPQFVATSHPAFVPVHVGPPTQTFQLGRLSRLNRIRGFRGF